MTYISSHKHVCTFICLLLCSILTNSLVACTGTHIENASAFYNNIDNQTEVEIAICLGVTDLFGLPSDFTISYDGVSAMPIIDASSTTLSATYFFSENAAPNGFFCDCNSGAPTVLSNTDTWTGTANSGLLSYELFRSDDRLTHECQIDCVNGQPTGISGGAANYTTNISACYTIFSRFSGNIEDELIGVTLAGAESGLCNDTEGMSVTINGALPAELGSFEATSRENSVHLNWTTFSENNVYKYIVERSPNGFSAFEELGFVGVFGNSTSLKSYSFEDTTPLAKGFYRLKTVDIDGTFAYSTIVFIEKEIRDISVTNIYPNPIEGPVEIVYETKAVSDIHFKVFDINGTLKVDRVLEPVNGFNKIELDFTEWREGIYFILFETGTERILKRVTKF